CGQICMIEILLTEMDKIAVEVDRLPPVIIDHELRAVDGAQVAAARNLPADFGFRTVLGAQLHQPHAEGQHAFQPFRILEDRIEAELPHASTAFPASGVEGTAW